MELRISWSPEDRKGSLKPQRRSPVQRKKESYRSCGMRKEERKGGGRLVEEMESGKIR